MKRAAELRLTDPELGFWVDFRLRRFGRRCLAVADVAGTPDVGVSRDVEPGRLVGPVVARLGRRASYGRPPVISVGRTIFVTV